MTNPIKFGSTIAVFASPNTPSQDANQRFLETVREAGIHPLTEQDLRGTYDLDLFTGAVIVTISPEQDMVVLSAIQKSNGQLAAYYDPSRNRGKETPEQQYTNLREIGQNYVSGTTWFPGQF